MKQIWVGYSPIPPPPPPTPPSPPQQNLLDPFLVRYPFKIFLCQPTLFVPTSKLVEFHFTDAKHEVLE